MESKVYTASEMRDERSEKKMENDNETVEQIHDELKLDPFAPNGAKPFTHYLADRILSAHNREMNALAEQKTAEAHEAFVKNAELADAIAAKDAEIENLKKENASLRVINCGSIYADEQLRDELSAKDAEIAKLRSLVKGLLEASSISCAECKYDCYSDHSNCIIHEAANYINKAREVVK